jgi:hypothetical protein
MKKIRFRKEELGRDAEEEIDILAKVFAIANVETLTECTVIREFTMNPMI